MIDWLITAHTQLRRKQSLNAGVYFVYRPISPSPPSSICVSFVLLKAWLTEIHEYAQKDVVIMLLGNKVSEASFFALHKKIWRITGPLAQF